MNKFRVRKDGPKAWLVEKQARDGEWGWVYDFFCYESAIRYADREARPAEGLSPTGRYARLSLPDDIKQVMEESVEDYKAGRFVDFGTPETASPRPEDVPVGEPWQVEVEGKEAIGYRNDPDDTWPWQVIFPRREGIKDGHWATDDDVTLVARLVPETTEQDDAPEFDPDHIYTDRIGNEWSHVIYGWRCYSTATGKLLSSNSTPPAEYGPYTRILGGRK